MRDAAGLEIFASGVLVCMRARAGSVPQRGVEPCSGEMALRENTTTPGLTRHHSLPTYGARKMFITLLFERCHSACRIQTYSRRLIFLNVPLGLNRRHAPRAAPCRPF